jgi:hypothetical protein
MKMRVNHLGLKVFCLLILIKPLKNYSVKPDFTNQCNPKPRTFMNLAVFSNTLGILPIKNA